MCTWCTVYTLRDELAVELDRLRSSWPENSQARTHYLTLYGRYADLWQRVRRIEAFVEERDR